MNPLAQRSGRQGHVCHDLRGELGVLRVLLHLPEGHVRDVVLVEELDALEESDVVELGLGLRPGGRLLHDRHDRAHGLHDHVRGLGVGLDLRNGLLVQLLERVHGRLERRHGLLQVARGVVRHGLGLLGLLLDADGVRLHLRLLRVSLAALRDDDVQQLLALLGLLRADRLLLLEVHAHLGHLGPGVVELAQAVAEFVGGVPQLLLPVHEHGHVALH
mmetsp:Transcript_89292/g.261059  ORF Transcript_89292/g.261059 Transcript_89292/m.261059 type:complete len:217 (+) Transcript_89292:413-1063(+)